VFCYEHTLFFYSHGTTFSKQTFNPEGQQHSSTSIVLRPSSCVISKTSISGTAQLESQLSPSSRTFTGTGIPLTTCTTFNPSPTAQPAAPEQITGSTSVAAQAAVSVLLPASSTPSVTTAGPIGNDSLYHSTKF
jgi:hypothetical protein